MYSRRTILILTIIFAFAAAAHGTEKKTSPVEKAAAPKPNVVAVVNGAEIGLDDFTREVFRAQTLVLNTGRTLTAPGVVRLRTEVIEALIRQELLYQESKKTVKVTDGEIASELEKLKDQFPSTADFARAVPLLRAQVERALSTRTYVDKVYTSKATATDGDVRAAYDANRANLRQPEQVKTGYILIKVDPQWGEAKKAAARKKIADVRKKALEGQDFAALARASSEDVTASLGGSLGFVRQGQLLRPIEQALFSLKPNEVSDVVETRVGYHLLKAYERTPEMTVPFENVKDQLRNLLKQEKGQQEANSYAAELREKAKVQILLPAEE
jgi:parvulin-like peptidyl-prolyl isomerase